MRCHETEQRLLECHGILSDSDFESELREHIRQCHNCQVLAMAERTLVRDLDIASIDDNNDVLSMPELKARVEARVKPATSGSSKEYSLMKTVLKHVRKRPRLGFSIGIVAVALIMATLVPFSFENTIGYEVAIAGVDKDLAMDSEKINSILVVLGLDDASFEVGDCETTCQLKISDLSSQKDVQLVTTVFDKLGNCALEEVNEVCETESQSFAYYLQKNITINEDDITFDSIYVIDLVSDKLELLCGDSSETFSIWIGSDTINCESIDLNMNNVDDSEQFEVQLSLTGCGQQDISSNCKTIICTTSDSAWSLYNISEDDITAAKTNIGELPESYELAQNYPNPFNPTTTIKFSLPQSEHVLLEIFNINGQKITTLIDETYGTGTHTVEWNASDDQAASGIYFYHLTAGEFTDSEKMTLVK